MLLPPSKQCCRHPQSNAVATLKAMLLPPQSNAVATYPLDFVGDVVGGFFVEEVA